MQYLVLLAGLLVLSGCGTYEWVKADQPTANADAALIACETKAVELYPTVVASDSRTGRTRGATASCVQVAGGSKCETTGAKSGGASQRSYDINRSDRRKITERCMRADGWRRVRID